MAEALEVERLSVRRGTRLVLSEVSLSAQHGSLLAIVGPNGAGKSTLLKALLGLTPSHGAIRLNGEPLASLPVRERARSIAYVPQHSASLTGVSVLDVIAQARYAHRDRLGRVDPHDPAIVRAVALAEVGELTRRAFDTLSGGEQRRVVLARALATGSKVLLFDEPTAGLDVAHALRFFTLVRRLLAEGCAIVCVLHELADVRRRADRALLLERGRCVAFGPVADALCPERIARVYGVHVHERAAMGFSLDGQWS